MLQKEKMHRTHLVRLEGACALLVLIPGGPVHPGCASVGKKRLVVGVVCIVSRKPGRHAGVLVEQALVIHCLARRPHIGLAESNLL